MHNAWFSHTRYVGAVSLYDALDSMKVLGYCRLDAGRGSVTSEAMPNGWGGDVRGKRGLWEIWLKGSIDFKMWSAT